MDYRGKAWVLWALRDNLGAVVLYDQAIVILERLVNQEAPRIAHNLQMSLCVRAPRSRLSGTIAGPWRYTIGRSGSWSVWSTRKAATNWPPN